MSTFPQTVCALSCILLGGCLGSRDEVARTPAPGGDVDGVIVETNGGATTSFGYEVHVVERGDAPWNGSRVALLYGAARNESAYGVNLRWDSQDVLLVEYLDARSTEVVPASVKAANRSVNVLLRAGIRDATAPPGGMLYNLRRTGKP
jgi:hypothetical protein